MKHKKHLSKTEQVELWRQRLAGAQSLILFSYSGIKAGGMAELRRRGREAGVTMGIVKNTLMRRALADSPMQAVTSQLKGTLAFAIGREDPTLPARVLVKYAGENDRCQVVGGVLGGNVIDAAGVVALSKAPGRDELRAMFLGLLQGVPTKFVRLLDAIPGGFVRVLAARKAALEESSASAA